MASPINRARPLPLPLPTVPTLGGAPPPRDEEFLGGVIDGLIEYVDQRVGALETSLGRLQELDDLAGSHATLNKSLTLIPDQIDRRLAGAEDKAISLVRGELDREIPARVTPLVRLTFEGLLEERAKSLGEIQAGADELKAYLGDFEGRTAALVGRAVERDYGARLEASAKALDERLTGRDAKHLAALDSQRKALEDWHRGQAKVLQESHAAQLAEMDKAYAAALVKMTADCDARVKDAVATVTALMSQMKDVVAAIPQPQILIPPDAIQVKLLPSVVNVPKDSISVAVQQAKADVHIAVPEGPAPVVNVTVQPAKKTTKSIDYDQFGRPARITEQETPESKE